MKRTIILLTLLIAIHSSPAAEGERISVHLKKVSLQNIFRFYKKLSGLDPVLSSDVKKMSEQTLIDFDTGDSMLKSEAIKALEKAVMKQTGVVITPLDSSTASVTYNDALLAAFAQKAKRHGIKVRSPESTDVVVGDLNDRRMWIDSDPAKQF